MDQSSPAGSTPKMISTSETERWQLASDKPMFRSPVATPAENPLPSTGRGAGDARGSLPQIISSRPVVQEPADDRRGDRQPTERMIGRVASCNGARAVVATSATHLNGAESDFWSVGKMISIEATNARVVGMVCGMHTVSGRWADDMSNDIAVDVELVGEVTDHEIHGTNFRRGISNYPPLGAVAHRIRARDLEIMHDVRGTRGIEVGTLSQNENLPARISVDDLLRRHFAVLGTTGVGKSSAVTLLVRQAVAAVPTLRVLMLDPHNEFMSGLGNIAVGVDVADLNLPYWLFRFEELEDIVFRGHPVAEESEVLREFVSQAKTIRKGGGRGSPTVSADTPVPYRMTDIIAIIDDMVGHLEPRYERILIRSLKVRIESLMQDPRYAFLFINGGLEDNFDKVIGTIFRLPAHGKPVSVLNLAAVPSDVVNAVVSVLARLAFDVAYASKGALNVLLVCEEAHRYVPSDASAGFMPARRAIARIAKEGRKYGCAVAIVTQRPGELDSTILSQCSTVFAMRLTNDRDQEIIRAAISDSSSSTISFLSSLDNREAIAFGEAVAAPMRLYFTFQQRSSLPFVGQITNGAIVDADQIAIDELVSVLRHTVVLPRRGVEQVISGGEQPVAPKPVAIAPAQSRLQATASPVRQVQAPAGSVRASLLRKPLDQV